MHENSFYFCEYKLKCLTNVTVDILCVMYLMYLSAFGYCGEFYCISDYYKIYFLFQLLNKKNIAVLFSSTNSSEVCCTGLFSVNQTFHGNLDFCIFKDFFLNAILGWWILLLFFQHGCQIKFVMYEISSKTVFFLFFLFSCVFCCVFYTLHNKLQILCIHFQSVEIICREDGG